MEDFDKQISDLLDPNSPEGFAQEKANLLGRLIQQPSDEAVRTYSSRLQINLCDAKKRLEENYKKEVESVDSKEIALRLSNAMKVLSPKMMGLELRERDREELAKRAISKVDSVVAKCESMIENAKSEVYADTVKMVSESLDLSKIVRSMIELEKQNKWVYEEYLKTQKELNLLKAELSKKRSLLTLIKNFFSK